MGLGVGSLIELSVRGLSYNQVWMNTWTYQIGLYPVAVSAAQVAEAYWAHVKSAYRGMALSLYTGFFQEVVCRELDSATGALGTFAVPAAEKEGTRSSSGNPAVAPFLAVGAKLNVSSRVTRPGAKRFAGFGESDFTSENVEASVRTVVGAVCAVCATPVVLGAPAALVELAPVVVRKDRATGLPVAHQPIESFSVAQLATTQNTRKIGRGN